MKGYLDKLLFLAVTIVCMSLFLIPLSTSVSAEKTDGEYEIKYNESDRIIVSLGDSYSSGEGIDEFYDYNKPLSEKVTSQDWLSHRSQNAWSGMLTLKDFNGNIIKMKEHRGNKETAGNWYFAAMSGAITNNILDIDPVPENLSDTEKKKGGSYDYRFKEYKKRYYILTGTIPHYYQGVEEIEPQLNVYDQIGDKKVDYVTMTLGGNDVGFVPIVTQAACQFEYLEFKGSFPFIGKIEENLITSLQKIIDEKLPVTLSRLEECYKAIDSKSNKHATILIAGYPRLFGTKHKGKVFSSTEIEEINNATNIFNDKLDEKIQELRDKQGMNIYFVPVAEKFGDKGAYSGTGIFSDKGAYINSIYPSKVQDIEDSSPSAYSMHPNKDGAKIYADCVQSQINELEDNYTKIWGRVTDENGNPLDNVKITLIDAKNKEWQRYTENGYYAFEINYVPDYHYSVKYELSGYKTLVVREEKGGKRITINAKLRKNNQIEEIKPTEIVDDISNEESSKIDTRKSTEILNYGGHRYYIYFNVANTWNEAKKYCESLGGYLAVINNKDENTVLYNYMINSGYESAYFGYSDSESEGNWKWVDNETSDYINWAEEEPNNQNNTENYAMFYFKYTDGKWNDGDFNGRTLRDTTAFICEWDSVDNENEVVYLDQLAIKKSDQYNDNEGDSFVFPIGKHRFTRGNTDINGTSYEHGIEGWIARWNYTAESSWAYSVFDLSGKYSHLNGKCVLIQSRNMTDFDTTLDFIGDGNLIKSYHLTPDSIPFNINLDVSGINDLKIYFHDNVSKEAGTSFGLVNMKLTKVFIVNDTISSPN